MTMPYYSNRHKADSGDTIDGRTHADWHEKAQKIIGKTFNGTVRVIYNDKQYEGELSIQEIRKLMESEDFHPVPTSIINSANLDPERKQVLVNEDGVIEFVAIG